MLPTFCTVLYCRVGGRMDCRVEIPPVPGLRTLDSRTAPVHLLYGAVTVISLVRDSCFRGALCFEFEIGEKKRVLKRDITTVNASSVFETDTSNIDNSNSVSTSDNYSDHNVDVAESDMSSDFPHMIVQVLAVQYSQPLVAHADAPSPKPEPKPNSPSSLLHTAPTVTSETWSKSSTAITVWAREESHPRLSVRDGARLTCRNRGEFLEIVMPLHPAVDQDGATPVTLREDPTHSLPTSANNDDVDASSPTSFPPTPPLLHPLIASLLSLEVGHLLLLSSFNPADLLTYNEVSKSFLDFLSDKCSQCCPCCCCDNGSDRGSAAEGEGEGGDAEAAVKSKRLACSFDGIGINQERSKVKVIMRPSPCQHASSLKVPHPQENTSLMSSSAPTGTHVVSLSVTNISTLPALSSSPSLGCM